MTEIITFEQALEETNSSDRAVLLGNGFSIAQTEGDFAYANLLEKSTIAQNTPLQNVFTTFQTVDFEEVVKSLELASKVAGAYGRTDEERQYIDDAENVRQQLIQAIRTVHPNNFTNIPDSEVTACAEFLKFFGKVFTLNYDLLLYWISLHSGEFRDGFGLGDKANGFLGPFKEDAHCSIYNIHGGLHLFLTPSRDVEKRISSVENLLTAITGTISDQKRFPLYVAEGTATQKLNKIKSVPYLNHCYEELKTSSGNLFSFGHSVNGKDRHIYDAIFSSGIDAFYYCLFDQTKIDETEEDLARYKTRNPRIAIKYVDASQMNIWGKQEAA